MGIFINFACLRIEFSAGYIGKRTLLGSSESESDLSIGYFILKAQVPQSA